MEAMKIEPGKANQNGDTEQSHNRLKKIMDQQLMLRGSRDFESIEEYTDYLRKIFGKMNSLVKKSFTEELAYLKPLPSYKIDMMKKEVVKVKSWSTVTISHNVYSVHSRLIGEWVTAKLLPDTIEIWHAQRCVEVLPRLKGRKKHFVQYRHVIDYLMRKPGAFENYIYKEDLFPTHRFRVAYDYLHDVNPQKAVKEYLKILFLAATENESLVDDAIELLIRQEVAITFDAVNAIVLKGMRLEPMREVKVMAVDTTIYDALLQQRQDGGVAA